MSYKVVQLPSSLSHSGPTDISVVSKDTEIETNTGMQAIVMRKCIIVGRR